MPKKSKIKTGKHARKSPSGTAAKKLKKTKKAASARQSRKVLRKAARKAPTGKALLKSKVASKIKARKSTKARRSKTKKVSRKSGSTTELARSPKPQPTQTTALRSMAVGNETVTR